MKQLFNFYVEDKMKDEAMRKLVEINGETTKGQYAAFLRACTKLLIMTPKEQLPKELIDLINNEYITCLKTGKRSVN